MKTETRWKFLRDGMKSEHGNHVWEAKKWCKTEGKLKLCTNGFHCSKEIGEAFSYVQGEILALVEVRGKCVSDNNKEAWEEMRVVKAYKWQKKDSVAIAIYAAELVIGIFEKEYPNDDRPRKAIEAAKRYLEEPTKENKEAARAAARAAEAAWAWATATAMATARAARAAAMATAMATARAAEAAVWAAEAAAAAVEAKKELLAKIHARFNEQLKELEPYD